MLMTTVASIERIEPVEELDLAMFQSIMASLPAGVAVVTTIDAYGAPRGFTATSVCSVSADPPTVLVCIDTTSRTLPALRREGRFVLNILRAGRAELAAQFASKNEDKFAGVVVRATRDGLPLLAADALAWAECETIREVLAGDHVIFLARIERGGAAAHELPLVYFDRRFGTWVGEEKGGNMKGKALILAAALGLILGAPANGAPPHTSCAAYGAHAAEEGQTGELGAIVSAGATSGPQAVSQAVAAEKAALCSP
jgi:flavin reductase ActVB